MRVRVLWQPEELDHRSRLARIKIGKEALVLGDGLFAGVVVVQEGGVRKEGHKGLGFGTGRVTGHFDFSRPVREYAGKDLEEGGFSGAIVPHETHDLTVSQHQI